MKFKKNAKKLNIKKKFFLNRDHKIAPQFNRYLFVYVKMWVRVESFRAKISI